MAQLGRDEEARLACEDLLQRKPDMAAARVRQMLRDLPPPYLEHFLDGLHKAGLPD